MSGDLVTVLGGSGFIGTRLVRNLVDSGHRVRIVDTQDSEAFPALRQDGDVRSADQMLRTLEGSRVIYNLAAQHRDDVRPVSLYDEVNVEGARVVCQAAERLDIRRIVFISSVAIYGSGEGEKDEATVPAPENDYGRTKLEAEAVYREWARAGEGRTLSIVRPTVVFGPGNRGNVYNLLAQIASGRFFMVGSGRNHKSMAYVENVVGFLRYLLDRDQKEEIFNYVDKPDLDMTSLVSTVREVMGKGYGTGPRLPFAMVYGLAGVFDLLAVALNKRFPVSRVRLEKFCANTQFSSDRVRQSGYQPAFDLREALYRTIQAEFGQAAPERRAA